MKNFRSVSKARLLLFLSGFCFAVPTQLKASDLKNHGEIVTENSCLNGRGVCYKRVNTTGLLNSISTTFSELKNSRTSNEKRFVNREGNNIRFNREAPDLEGDSFQSKGKVDSSQGGLSELIKNLPKAEGLKVNTRANVFGLEKVATQSGLRNKSRYAGGARFTLTHEFSDSGKQVVKMSEFGALLPLLSREDGLIYIDLKSKLYDAKASEISTGVVFRRKMSPFLTGGINLFTDVRFLPEGNYGWYSLGGEIFFKSFSLNANYYRSNKRGNLSLVKKLDLNPTSLGKSTVVLHERVAGNGCDLGFGLTLNEYIHVRGGAFLFNSPYNKEEKFSGYRAGIDFSLYLNDRFSVLVSPEFVTDNKKNSFSINVGFDLPVGKDYTKLLGHVRRDKDIVLFDTDNSYDVNAVFLSGEKEHKVEEIIEVSKGNEIKTAEKPTTEEQVQASSGTSLASSSPGAKNVETVPLRKLYIIKDVEKENAEGESAEGAAEITLPKELKSVIVSDETLLKVHVSYPGGEKIVDYLIPRSKRTLKFSPDADGSISHSMINGATVDLGDSSKYTLTDVVFNASLIKSDKEHPFQDDKNVSIFNSELEFSHDKLQSAFYSTKNDVRDGKPDVSYSLKDVYIKLPTVEHDPKNPAKGDFKALFAGDLDKTGKIDVTLAGEIKIDTKPSIEAKQKAERAKTASETQTTS
ncbi:inverse autotransporter beta domain-containing protein [Neorickettsia findlayensis]|nr:inverse autotransporter beta domain-containing protein [Neorickettsia findlayensis]